MRRIKKGIAVALSLVLALSLTACGTKKSAEKNDKLVIAYQNGLSYTPLLVMKEKKLIIRKYTLVIKLRSRFIGLQKEFINSAHITIW